MQQQEEVVTNTPTPSRTIRITHDGDYTVSVNHGVTKAENGRSFLTFSTLEDAITAFGELRAADVRSSYLTYSLFVKSQAELTEDSLKEQVLALVPSAHVTYLRVDDNTHTGKVVVDILEDYQTVKGSSSETLRFFHFDPKRVRSQGSRPPREGDSSPRTPRVQRDFRPRDQGEQRPPRRQWESRPQRDQGEQRPQRDQGEQRPPRRQWESRPGVQRDQGQQSDQDGFQPVRTHRSQGQGGRGGQRSFHQGRGGGRGNNTNSV
jgi:hypothetical protein